MAAHAPCGLPPALLASSSEEAAASPHLTASGAGPCSRTPPRRRKAPPAGGETCIAAALARGRALLPGRSLGLPIDRVAERLAGRALLRDRRWHAPDCRVLASDPRSSPDLLLHPSLGAGSDVACARVGGVSPEWRSGTTRSAPPPSWFDSHHGGLLRAPVSRVLHLEPDLAPTAFPRRAPADRRWRAAEAVHPVAPGVGTRGSSPPSSPSHPSKNPHPLRSRAEDANLGPAAPRHRGRCPRAVFTTSRRCSCPRGQPAALALAGSRCGHCPSMGFVPLRGARPRPPPRARHRHCW